jgi:ABC-type branched-subunit amino acid transport system ATPase component
VAYKWRSLTGGSDGIAGVPKTELFWGGPSLASGRAFYFLAAVCVLLSLVLCRAVVRSPYGRSLQAIRENERRFTSLGRDPRPFKLVVFVIAAVFAGLAGALFAPFRGFASPEVMFWVFSGQALMMVTIGGIGTLVGPILGAMVFILVQEVLSSYTEHWMIFTGVVFRGEDVTALGAPARCRRGHSRTFQNTSIFPELSVLENVRMAVQLKSGGNFRLLGGRALLDESERRAHESLAFLGLDARASEPASTLPHGDQRLLEIAMAVAQEPQLLLLDAPTQGLSPEDTAATVAVIRQIARAGQLTILLVEHDMDVVFDLAERITVQHFGRVIADGAPAEIRTNAEVQLAYLGTVA